MGWQARVNNKLAIIKVQQQEEINKVAKKIAKDPANKDMYLAGRSNKTALMIMAALLATKGDI